MNISIKKDFPSQNVHLKKRDSGEGRDFLLRPYQYGDEKGIIDCIRSEYGDSYFKRDFYIPEKIREMAMGSKYVFFVAESEGRIMGVEVFVLFSEWENYIEPATQILREECRRYGLADAMVKYTFPLAEQMEPFCLFVHAVTFHDITQKVCGRQGMVPAGFRLGSFLTEKMSNSYLLGRCEKYSEGIMILPVGKQNAGKVYFPEELQGFAKKIYGKLGVTYRFMDSGDGTGTCSFMAPVRENAELYAVTDNMQRMILVSIRRSGKDLCSQIRQLLNGHDERLWTVQVTISADTPISLWEYAQLKEMGFFFTGMKPVCGIREQYYMQWVGDTELYMEDYILTENFLEIRDDIQKFFDNRKK